MNARFCPDCGQETLRHIEDTDPDSAGEYKEISTCDGCKNLVTLVRFVPSPFEDDEEPYTYEQAVRDVAAAGCASTESPLIKALAAAIVGQPPSTGPYCTVHEGPHGRPCPIHVDGPCPPVVSIDAVQARQLLEFKTAGNRPLNQVLVNQWAKDLTENPPPPCKLVCAWCKDLMVDGPLIDGMVSHGICDACFEKQTGRPPQ